MVIKSSQVGVEETKNKKKSIPYVYCVCVSYAKSKFSKRLPPICSPFKYLYTPSSTDFVHNLKKTNYTCCSKPTFRSNTIYHWESNSTGLFSNPCQQVNRRDSIVHLQLEIPSCSPLIK
ncbi:hypothetical protein DM860_002273 [Cuscuta australis]|uniref:Uncharacterized protein n=1 Tax=Cuscuta australis TaxID=267555 RepID=A0A328CXV1_9ASTE|nr:hypothetical protein DM860_002273 [Cuscuta australis]